MHIKICGITNEKNALHAVQAGASHIGLIFVATSPRKADLALAKAIVMAVDQKALAVGVFQDQSAEEIIRTAIETNIDMVQLHGQEDAAFCRSIFLRLGKPVIKTIIVEITDKAQGHAKELEEKILPFAGQNQEVPFILFDRKKGEKSPDWLADTLRQIALMEKERPFPIPPYFIAGGLSTTNLPDIFKKIKAAGVDVASGVEASPGIKDPALVAAFIDTAKTIQGVLRSTK